MMHFKGTIKKKLSIFSLCNSYLIQLWWLIIIFLIDFVFSSFLFKLAAYFRGLSL